MRVNFDNRLYTSEVIITDSSESASTIFDRIDDSSLIDTRNKDDHQIGDVSLLRLDIKYFDKLYNPKDLKLDAKKNTRFRGNTWLYDIYITKINNLLMFSVPYTQIAIKCFPELDTIFKGSSIEYKQIELNKLLVTAGLKAKFGLKDKKAKPIFSMNSCSLNYEFLIDEKTSSKQRIEIKGADLPNSTHYKYLIRPFINKKNNTESIKIYPTNLGFTYKTLSKKRCSVSTDKNGNFRFRVGVNVDPICHLTEAIYRLSKVKGMCSTSPNVPIESYSKTDS